MNILIIGPVPQFLGSYNTGGIANHVWSLASKLNQKGHNVDVLAIGRYYKETRIKNGVRLYGLEKNLATLFKTLLKLPRLFYKLGFSPIAKAYFHASYSLLRLHSLEDLNRYDVIHLHGLHNLGTHALELLNIEIPKIVSIHSYTGLITSDKKEIAQRLKFINEYLEDADGIIHVSKTDRNKGIQQGLSFNGVDHVIHNGVEESFNQSIDPDSNICFVGYLTMHKRLSLLLDAVEYLQSDIEALHIAGDGPLRDEVELATREKPVISYHGVIPNQEVREMMNRSSLLVVPSRGESFGLVYIEALFEGTGVLGYGPILKEFQEVMGLTEDEKKLVVPISSEDITPRKLAEKIDAAYKFRQTETGIETMKNVRQKAIDNFSWPSIIQKIEKMYQEVINYS